MNIFYKLGAGSGSKLQRLIANNNFIPKIITKERASNSLDGSKVGLKKHHA